MTNVYHGDIISCDNKNSLYSYLAEENGRIVYLGDKLPEKYSRANTIEVKGALLPAFVDTHVHFSSWAIFSATTDIKSSTSHEEMLEALLDYDRRENPKNILSFGASAHSVKEKRLMTKEELDRAFPDKPVSIICYDGHSSINNTAMLRRYPKAVQEARGFDMQYGNITRESFYLAVDFVTGQISVFTLMNNISKAFDRLAAAGVGMVHAAEGVGFAGDLDVTLCSTIARGQKSGFQTRIFFQTLDLNKVIKRKLPRSGGCFAAALDGCFGVCDAALTSPYEGQPDNSGILYRDPKEVRNYIMASHRKGLQVTLHCIGDKAVDIFLDAVTAAQKDSPREDPRHTVIHGEMLRPEQRQRILELGIPLARQPYFINWNLEPPEYYKRIMGSRAADLAPYKKELDMGIIIGAGSDAPVSNPVPLAAIHKLLNHSDPSKNVTIEQALRMHTWNGAYMTFDEKERGSLENGKIADMILLDQNPMKVKPEEIKNIKVSETILSGKKYIPGQKPASAIMRTITGQGSRI